MTNSLVRCFGVALLAGCAGPFAGGMPHGRLGGVSPEAVGAWEALVHGRDSAAVSSFRTRLAKAPADVLALFGDASLAFERGDNPRALASYLALLERAATDPDRFAPLLAAMAVGRIATLLDEHAGPEADRRAVEDRLLALPLVRLRWEARHGLALILDRVARRRGDANTLSRAARAAGCIRALTVARPAGILPHMDLDLPAPGQTSKIPPGRDIRSLGCVISVPAYAGRSGAQRVFADLRVSGGGSYDIVLDFQGEARMIVDGGKPIKHGNEHAYGARVSSVRVKFSQGHHQLELRLATFGGRPNLVVMVFPSGPDDRDTSSTPQNPLKAPAEVESVEAALVLAEAYVANRRGDAGIAWPAAARLDRWRSFALGLAFTAVVARDDPSRPANFGRDRARTLLRAAVAIDPQLARSRYALAGIALEDDRPREALDEALAATKAAPAWWPPELTLHAAYRLRGLEWDADRALDRALAHAPGACSVIVTALGRAEHRRDLDAEGRLSEALAACGQDSDEQVERLRRRGDLVGVEAALRRMSAIAPDRDDAKLDLASTLLAQRRGQEAADLIASLVHGDDGGDGHEGEGQVRLADALTVAGRPAEAKVTIAKALLAHPENPDLQRAARALAVPLPLDSFRLDGRQAIRDFQASGRRYASPAVIVLDRTVTRIFPSGAEMVLTHEIVRVQSKEAIEKWGEVAVPGRTEILVLRTHKPDGTTREPEEFAGKETLSAADLTVGDYLEKETIEIRPPRDAFIVNSDLSGGFLGDRFYFQSFDAPLDRSEYLLVTSRDAARRMRFDRRGGAPVATQAAGPNAANIGSVVESGAALPADTVVTTFAASAVPQLFPERSSVPAIEHVPSVRVSIQIGWPAWSRFLREQMYGTTRTSPGLKRAADQIRAAAVGANPEALPAALTAWVGQNVEAEDDLRASASFGVARGRGNRLAVILALARELGLDARPVLARSRLTADGDAPTPLEEADDFADPLVRFELPGRKVFFVDPRLKHAPFGYLPPGLDGARVLVLDQARFEIAHGRSDDHRTVDMAVRLDGQGGGVVQAAETLRGWPALEWAEIVDRFGLDRTKLRQDFEQRWLGVHFPGAVLKDLEVDILGIDGRKAGTNTGAQLAAVPAPQSVEMAPGVPYTAAQVRLRYSFSSTRLALKRDREMRFLPTFFRSQPGRRYATEPRRGTTLLTGFDVPLDLNARVELPPGARVVDPQRASGGEAAFGAGGSRGVVARRGGYRFLEERRIESPASAAPVILLRREARFPIMRVPLQDYPTVADELRRVDVLEQEEVRIGIGPERQ